MVTCVALIPARSGSKRIPHKNIKKLGGRPLIYYTIKAAQESGVFEKIVVSTDHHQYETIASVYGAEVVMRPPEMANDLSPDIEWVRYTLDGLERYDCFSILRPTSPFRTAETIKRAWEEFLSQDVDSLRAVEKVKQHPAKMWLVEGNRMKPLLDWGYSVPFQSLPEVYVQNASLEIAWTRVVDETDTISGKIIMPFFTEGNEGFDINTEEDWEKAEAILDKRK